MKSIIFASMLVMYVSCMYPMESEETFEHKIIFETYELLDTLPRSIREDLLRKTVNAIDKDYKFNKSLNRLFLSVEGRINFTPEHLAARYPWKVEKVSRGKYVMHYSGDNFKPVKITSKKPIVTGPNNNNVCIVDRCIVRLELIIEDSKKDRYFNLKQRFAAFRDGHKKLPAHPLTIHPDKNICVIEECTEESSFLSLYNLDTHETEALPDVQSFGQQVSFGPDDILLVLRGGTLYFYSHVDKKVKGIILGTRYIPASEFDQFRKYPDDVTDLSDFQRLLKLVRYRNNRNCYIRNFHYSWMYPDFVLLGVESYCVLIGISNRTHGARMLKLAHFDPCWYAQPEWDISIKTYDQHDYNNNPLNMLPARDAVSLVSWHMNDLGAYVLTAAAHNWLQNKEQNKKENKSEARLILAALYQRYRPEDKWILLLKSTYVDQAGERTNPFRDIFHAIKRRKHTHVTEVI